MNDRKKIKLAMVGAGRMAREHLRAFAASPEVCLAGIQSRTRGGAEALAREFGIAHVCDTLPELYDRSRADLVVVTVSVLAVQPTAIACCEYPWKILVEKPPGLSVAETGELRAVAENRGRDVRVALNRQWLSSTQTVLAQLAAVEGPRFVKVQDQQPFASLASSRHPPEVQARWMYANSIHTIDYFRILARGKVTRITPVFPWQPEAPSVVVAGVQFDSGDTGLYEAIWHAPGPWAATVTVSGRRWEMRPLEQGITQVLGGKAAGLPLHQWDQVFKPGFRLQAEAAVALAAGVHSSLPTLGESLQTMRLIEQIYPGNAGPL